MNPTDRWQPIAPASDDPGTHSRPTLATRKRRQAVAVACTQCRSGKAKCDGTRPICTRCRDTDLECQYDVPEGVSRAERMKLLKRDSLSSRVNEMERVIHLLRSGSDLEASTTLARLRLGESVGVIAKSFVPVPLPTSAGVVPSLPTQDSTGTSGSALSQEGPDRQSDSSSGFRYEAASTRYTSSTPDLSGWTIFDKISRLSSKGKQPATPNEIQNRFFMVPLFDREDLLLTRNYNDEEDSLEEDIYPVVDPRLLESPRGRPTVSSMETGFRFLSPEKEQSAQYVEGTRSIHATHLRQRQPIVNSIRIHNNFDIHNLFVTQQGSHGDQTNNYAADIEGGQVDNLFLPTWAMMTVNFKPGPGSLRYAFSGVLEQGTALIETGVPVEIVIETHPNMGALFDDEQDQTSGIVSIWAARMVHSLIPREIDFTSFAYMYLFWYLMRWMVFPSPETYELIPEWLRPTPNQLLMPHIHILDFVVWPAFREFAAQIPAMQEQMEWLIDMSNTVRCSWPFPLDEALVKREESEMLDLTETAKASVRDLSSWSVGPTFRGYLVGFI